MLFFEKSPIFRFSNLNVSEMVKNDISLANKATFFLKKNVPTKRVHTHSVKKRLRIDI